MPHFTDDYFFAFGFPELDAFKKSVQREAAETLGIHKHGSSNPAHVTVKYGLKLAPDEARAVCDHLQASVAHTKLLPAAIQFAGIGSFAESRTIFLKLEGPFVTAWRVLIEAFTALGYPKKRHEGETPHLTLFADLKKSQVAAVHGLVRARIDLPTGSTEARRLVLYRKAIADGSHLGDGLHPRTAWHSVHHLEF